MFSKNLLVRVITHWIVLKSVKLLVNILGTMRINSSNKTKVLLTSIQQAIKAVFVDSVVKMTQLILCQLINDQRFQSLVVLGFNTTLTAKVISRRSVTHMCFLAFSHQYCQNFLSKATDYFPHIIQQR